MVKQYHFVKVINTKAKKRRESLNMNLIKMHNLTNTFAGMHTYTCCSNSLSHHR